MQQAIFEYASLRQQFARVPHRLLVESARKLVELCLVVPSQPHFQVAP